MVLDRFLLPLPFSLRFLLVLGSVWVPFWPPKWPPGGVLELRQSALGGSKTVWGSLWFGSFFVLRFGIAFLTLLGSSWVVFEALRDRLEAFGDHFRDLGHHFWVSEVVLGSLS